MPEILHVCRAGGFECNLDDQRGWDHGVFVPLKLLYPAADIPVVELSMLKSLDAQVRPGGVCVCQTTILKSFSRPNV